MGITLIMTLGSLKVDFWIFQIILLVCWLLACIGFLLFEIFNYLEKKNIINFIFYTILRKKIFDFIKRKIFKNKSLKIVIRSNDEKNIEIPKNDYKKYLYLFSKIRKENEKLRKENKLLRKKMENKI